jgi:tryptophanyl-tRNA synthetase
MSKSLDSPQGTISLSDDDDAIVRKIKRAVTDNDGEVRFDVAAKPGVSNLLSLLAACTGRAPADVADEFTRYGDLKAATAQAVVDFMAPVRQRHDELLDDPSHLVGLLADGADRADAIATETLRRAEAAMGFLPRP